MHPQPLQSCINTYPGTASSPSPPEFQENHGNIPALLSKFFLSHKWCCSQHTFPEAPMRVEPSTRHGKCPRFLQPLSPWLEKVTPVAFGHWSSGEAKPKSQRCFHSQWHQLQIWKDYFCHWHGRHRPCSAGQQGSTGHSHVSRGRLDFRRCILPGDLIKTRDGKGWSW